MLDCVIMLLVMSMNILYGGAFNPPTIAHLKIIKFLINHFAGCHLMLLPTNNSYKEKDVIDFHHRVKMLEILIKDLDGQITISDYELKQNQFVGTYYTLAHYDHPYFVMGADQLANIETWVKYPDLIYENKFIVFPRDKIDLNAVIEANPILKANQDHFMIINFDEMDISSSMFRYSRDTNIVTKEIYEYIKANKLYEVD